MQDLKTLKQAILCNTVPDDFLIFVCPENYFVALQYVEAICKNKCLEIVPADSIYAVKQNSSLSLVFDMSLKLTVVKVDCFNEYATDYFDFTNTIVLCKSIDKKIVEAVDQFTVQIPKLTNWQIEAYASLCCNLPHDKIVDLCSCCQYDIYKICNETDKLAQWPDQESQQIVYDELKYDPLATFISFHIFDLKAAILRRDRAAIARQLYYRANCDFEPTGLVTLLLRSYRNILFLHRQSNSGVTTSELGKQSEYDKVYCANYTIEQLQHNIKFLANIDSKLKLGQFDLDSAHQLDYLIVNLL